jgi:uncharacterized protein YkwD
MMVSNGNVTTRWPWVLCALLTAALAVPVRAQQPPAPPAASATEQAAERELGRLLNRERARAHVPELELDARLVEAARAHARLMAENRRLDHQFAGEAVLRLRLAATGLRFDNAGENVASAADAASAHQDFLNSYYHRQNMLSANYNVMGIGVAEDNGHLYIVEDFAYRTKEYTEAQAEDAVAAAYLRFRGKEGGGPQRLQVPLLRERACAMAQADKVAPAGLDGLTGAHALVSYTTGRPERLPAELTDPARAGSAQAFAVGACFARTGTYPEGVYWIKVALY